MNIFSLRDIRNIFPDANVATLKNNLTNWLKKRYIERLKRLAEQVKPFFQKESFTKEICFSFSTGFLFLKKKKCCVNQCLK
jgi:hypothetical protein